MPRETEGATKQHRTRRALLKFFVATSLLALLPLGVARWQENRRRNAPKTPYTFPFAELAALDKVVQARFAVVPIDDFGVGRIGNRHQVFIPQTLEEKSVVAALKKRGYEVVFYVAGRGYLKNKPSWMGRHFLQGPIFITRPPLVKIGELNPYNYYPIARGTPVPIPTDLPDGGTILNSPLKASALNALRDFEISEGKDFRFAEWQIAARPVRATNQACADCHNERQVGRRKWPLGTYEELQLGDTLGVAMYAYRTKKKEPK